MCEMGRVVLSTSLTARFLEDKAGSKSSAHRVQVRMHFVFHTCTCVHVCKETKL